MVALGSNALCLHQAMDGRRSSPEGRYDDDGTFPGVAGAFFGLSTGRVRDQPSRRFEDEENQGGLVYHQAHSPESDGTHITAGNRTTPEGGIWRSASYRLSSWRDENASS